VVGGKVANSWKDRQRLGLAAEFRVMSELLLRDYNPSRLVVQDGYDLLLENGIRIEVKASHHDIHNRKYSNGKVRPTPNRKYHFSLNDGKSGKRGVDVGKVDFIIGWCVDDNVFFVIPSVELENIKGINIYSVSDEPSKFSASLSKYYKYREAWELIQLRGGKDYGIIKYNQENIP